MYRIPILILHVSTMMHDNHLLKILRTRGALYRIMPPTMAENPMWRSRMQIPTNVTLISLPFPRSWVR